MHFSEPLEPHPLLTAPCLPRCLSTADVPRPLRCQTSSEPCICLQVLWSHFMTSWWPLSGVPSWYGEGHLVSHLIQGHLKASWALSGASQGALVVKNPPSYVGDVRDAGSISELGRSPGEGNGNPLRYSFLENPMDRGAWWATVHGVAQSQANQRDLARTGIECGCPRRCMHFPSADAEHGVPGAGALGCHGHQGPILYPQASPEHNPPGTKMCPLEM